MLTIVPFNLAHSYSCYCTVDYKNNMPAAQTTQCMGQKNNYIYASVIVVRFFYVVVVVVVVVRMMRILWTPTVLYCNM